MMWSRAMKREAGGGPLYGGGGFGGATPGGGQNVNWGSDDFNWNMAFRGMMSGIAAGAQANEGWGGPGRAVGAAIGGGMAPYEADRAATLKSELTMSRYREAIEARLDAERASVPADRAWLMGRVGEAGVQERLGLETRPGESLVERPSAVDRAGGIINPQVDMPQFDASKYLDKHDPRMQNLTGTSPPPPADFDAFKYLDEHDPRRKRLMGGGQTPSPSWRDW